MRVNEKFVSIQGEGPYMGYWFSFIRLQGCNRRCVGCDTGYAQAAEGEGKEEAIEDVVEWVMAQGIPRVVFTGGEPMVQRDTLLPLIELLSRHKVQIHLETNGDFADPHSKRLYALCDVVAVSLKSAVTPIGLAFRDDAVVERAVAWSTWGPNVLGTWYLKFPIRTGALEEYGAHLRELFIKLRGVSVVVMPESDPSDSLEIMASDLKTLIEFTEQFPHIRVLPRLHRIVWGNKRGV